MTLHDFCRTNGREELLTQWDAAKNRPLTPADVTPGSHRLVWWQCENAHAWRSAVSTRTGKRRCGCPVCAGRVVLPEENSLAAKYPALAAEWDAEKNAPLLPAQVAPGTLRKVWWRCPEGHSWQASVACRAARSTGCPYCAGHAVLAGFNDLPTLCPDLMPEWDREKNGALAPETLRPYSNRRVWWRCPLGHSYAAVVADRARKKCGCLYCAGRKVLVGFNDLASKEPVLALQWHPTRNGSLTPQQLTSGSSRKVWWQCENGHAWRSAVSTRAGKQRCGCPVCAGRPMDRCTAVISEALAAPEKSVPKPRGAAE